MCARRHRPRTVMTSKRRPSPDFTVIGRATTGRRNTDRVPRASLRRAALRQADVSNRTVAPQAERIAALGVEAAWHRTELVSVDPLTQQPLLAVLVHRATLVVACLRST